MAFVIVAGVLGLITISGGLFLRRLFGQMAELRRQITRFDRQMRAQRARVKFLRYLLDENKDDSETGLPPRASVVNGRRPPSPVGGSGPAGGGQPLRQKRHLGLYQGGSAAALTTISTIARHGRFLRAVTGAAVTVAAVQLWSRGIDFDTPIIDMPPLSSPLRAPSGIPPTSRPAPLTDVGLSSVGRNDSSRSRPASPSTAAIGHTSLTGSPIARSRSRPPGPVRPPRVTGGIGAPSPLD